MGAGAAPEEYERREDDAEFDTEDYVVEPTYTTEIPIMRDPYEEVEEVEPEGAAGSGSLAARTGSSRPELPEDGRPQSR